MDFLTLSHKKRSKNIQKYLIDWEEQEKSIFQTNVKKFFYPFWFSHICCSEFPVIGTQMTIDILNFTLRLAVEVDGDQHTGFNKFFHKNLMAYKLQIERDVLKEKWCEINKIKLIRIVKEDLPLDAQSFLDKFGISL